MNLECLVYDEADFAHSEREPTSVSGLISGPRPFYYMWRREGGMDIFTFEDTSKIETAKLFRYSKDQIYTGVDLTKDKPTFVGADIIEALRRYIRK